MKQVIEKAIDKKAYVIFQKIIDTLKIFKIKNCYVAGGCFGDVVNDYDVFPVNKDDFSEISLTPEYQKFIVHNSINAITVVVNDLTIQFCKHHKNSLEKLVDSFDFAHCQIGMKIENEVFTKAYCSKAYVDYKISGNSSYIHSEYPLSSLFRCFKYHKREIINGYSWRTSVIKILNDLISRGFDGYDDFKNQLEAVDLCYKEDDFNTDMLFKLFELLNKKVDK